MSVPERGTQADTACVTASDGNPVPTLSQDLACARAVEVHEPAAHGGKLGPLLLAALGVVYGDIGTSPLYAFKECMNPEHGIALTVNNVYGILSLLFWSVLLVVSVKYVIFVMRADNRGEGGVLALAALALRGTEGHPRARWWLSVLGLFGAAMFYGDGMITPAISVLSAVEGLEVVTPAFTRWVLPITLVIIVFLFAIQKHGTAVIGRFFGPAMVLWFGALAVIGVVNIVEHPAVLAAFAPWYAIGFFQEHGFASIAVLGSVFLVLTGAEALYADMGHFGARPIRIAWFGFVMPALLINYFGQGALVLEHPEAIRNPFFLSVPEWATLPLVLLSGFATVIASQAVISGAFSMTAQAIKLGYLPRMRVQHTNEREIGQIYVPLVNRMLLLSVIALVLMFKTSSALASAYGIAVVTTMVITTVLVYVVLRRVWGVRKLYARGIVLMFLVLDLAFFAANALKIGDGGWFPLVIGTIAFTVLSTWERGRQILFERLRELSIPVDAFVGAIAAGPPPRVQGTAVFMTSIGDAVPAALLHNLKHNKVLHERVLLLTVRILDVPHTVDEERVQVVELPEGFARVEACYGFKEDPDVDEIMHAAAARLGFCYELMDTSYFVSRQTVVPTNMPGMALWREKLFAWMQSNAALATDFFKIPINRVVELGTQIDI
ncbi:potassium transporter Kup [Derxia lacustris]|uniref:potassium transporter Kup n=1 Tax=Derxia lacustris TaxID=764842 RepID=UPI000A173235|nr:potassium transporter Kup [Derxia lacustris]